MADPITDALDRFMDVPAVRGVSGLLQNPMVQGVGMMAAGGFNPLLGLLAGPIIQNDRDRAALSLDQARENLRATRGQNDALDRLQTMSTENAPVMAGRVPLLDVETGQPMDSGTPLLSTPAGQREMMGLLTRISPGAATQGLLAQQGPGQRQTAFIREAIALGFDPSKPEDNATLRDLWIEQKMGSSKDFEARLTELQLMREERQEREEAEQVRQQRTRDRTNIFGGLTELERLADLNQQLENTFVRTGGVAPDLRLQGAEYLATAQRALGKDTSALQSAITNRENLDNGLNALLLGMNEQLELRNLAQYRTLQEAKPSSQDSPYALANQFANLAEIFLDQAEIKGVEVPDRARVERFIEEQRAFSQSAGRTPETQEDLRDVFERRPLNDAEREELDERLRRLRGERE